MRIPSANAYLCQDCNCIGDAAVQCECGSKALMALSPILNRPPRWDGRSPNPNPCSDCIEVQGHFYCDMNCGPCAPHKENNAQS